MNRQIKQLEDLLGQNPENALIHYTLGVEYLRAGENEKATAVLQKAVSLDPGYSAAYGELGKALVASELHEEATDIFNKGIAVAVEKGDIQTAKEMRVFLKRISK